MFLLAVGCREGEKLTADTAEHEDTGTDTDTGAPEPLTPVYVTLAGHVEDHDSLWLCPQWTQTVSYTHLTLPTNREV